MTSLLMVTIGEIPVIPSILKRLNGGLIVLKSYKSLEPLS